MKKNCAQVFNVILYRIPPVFMLFFLLWIGCAALTSRSSVPVKGSALLAVGSLKYANLRVISDPLAGLHSMSSFVYIKNHKYICLWPYGMGESCIGKLGQNCVVSGERLKMGVSQYDRSLIRQGVEGKLSVSKIVSKTWPRTPLGILLKYRIDLIDKVSAHSKAMEGALITALIFGYRTRLATLQELFKTIGLSHMLSVSGSHFALALGLLLLVLREFEMRKKHLVYVSIFFSVVFYYLTGMNVAALRACLMASGAQFMFFSHRRIDLLSLVSIAGICILVTEPASSLSLSFQLSFLSVIGIALYFGRFESFGRAWFTWIPSWIIQSGALGCSAQILTFPLILVTFRAIAPLGILSTLAVTLLFEAIIGTGILFVCFSPISKLLSTFFITALKILANLIINFSLALSEIPGMYYVVSRRASLVWAVCFSAIACVLLWMKSSNTQHRNALDWRDKFIVKRYQMIISGVVVSAFLLWVFASSGTVQSRLVSTQNSSGVYFFNVGQGDATLIRDCGTNVLIDAGPDELVLKKELRKAHVAHIDTLIFTHGHDDHIRGADMFSSATHVKQILVAQGVQNDNGIRQISRITHAPIVQIKKGFSLKLPSMSVRVLSPSRRVVDPDDNASCLIMSINKPPLQKSISDYLITGDAEAESLAEAITSAHLRRIGILKLGHHGSKKSLTTSILEDVKISQVIISVGENSYGHPHKDVLKLLNKYHIPVKRTDVSGTIYYGSVAQ